MARDSCRARHGGFQSGFPLRTGLEEDSLKGHPVLQTLARVNFRIRLSRCKIARKPNLYSSMQPLRFRQIHLDFHTSEKISGIGSAFSKTQFQEMLVRGHVNSVTLFAKCHHGLSYHNTKIGLRHPGLDFELLPRQIEACREIDVKCPIYISAGLDEYIAYKRPEWIAVSREGVQSNPLCASWKQLAFDTPYLSYLCEQIEEIVDNYDASDGIFLDIIRAKDNFSPLGMLAMTGHDVDPLDAEQVKAWNWRTLQDYYARATAVSKKGDENRRVFIIPGTFPRALPKRSSGNRTWKSKVCRPAVGATIIFRSRPNTPRLYLMKCWA